MSLRSTSITDPATGAGSHRCALEFLKSSDKVPFLLISVQPIEAYQKASDTFTVHPSIWKRLGNAYHLSGAYPQAISAYDRARAEGYQDPIEFYDIAIERACRESGAGEEKEYENDDNDEDECNETEVVESRRARWKARLGAFRVHIAVTISKEVKK